ncbi:hypothetical protein DB347_15270 [Opitutaceae bacterium EW11]|nr:hypothetical protein DB347_15270 [Opitutaceae bacterium EW11]
MSAPSSSGKLMAEIRYADDRSAVSRVWNRPIHQFWHLLEPHFENLWLAPHRRSDGAGVFWLWKPPSDSRPPSSSEMADLRKKLNDANRRLLDGPVGISDDERRAGGATDEMVKELAAQASRIVAHLVGKSDSDLAAYVCRTDAGIRIHSWGSSIPAQPYDPASQRWEVSGTVLVSGKPSAGHVVRLENRKGLRFGETRSDAQGQFVFEDVSAGNYRVRVLADRVPFPSKGQNVRIENESVTGLELHSSSIIDEPEDEDPDDAESSEDRDEGTPPDAAPAAVPPQAAASAPDPGQSGGKSRRVALWALLLLLLLAGGVGGIWYGVYHGHPRGPQRDERISTITVAGDLAPEKATPVSEVHRTGAGVGEGSSAAGSGASSSGRDVQAVAEPEAHVGRVALHVPRVTAPLGVQPAVMPSGIPGAPGNAVPLAGAPSGVAPASAAPTPVSKKAGQLSKSGVVPEKKTARPQPVAVVAQPPAAKESEEDEESHADAPAAETPVTREQKTVAEKDRATATAKTQKTSPKDSPVRADPALPEPEKRGLKPTLAAKKPGRSRPAAAAPATSIVSPSADRSSSDAGAAAEQQDALSGHGKQGGDGLGIQAIDDALPGSERPVGPNSPPPPPSAARSKAARPSSASAPTTAADISPDPEPSTETIARTASPARATLAPAKRTRGSASAGSAPGGSSGNPSDAVSGLGAAVPAASSAVAAASGETASAEPVVEAAAETDDPTATPGDTSAAAAAKRNGSTNSAGEGGTPGTAAGSIANNGGAPSPAAATAPSTVHTDSQRTSASKSSGARGEGGAASAAGDASAGASVSETSGHSSGMSEPTDSSPADAEHTGTPGAGASPAASPGGADSRASSDAVSGASSAGLADASGSSADAGSTGPGTASKGAQSGSMPRGVQPGQAAGRSAAAPLSAELYFGGWKPKIARDVILPTLPTRTGEDDAVDAVRRETQKAEELRLPILFRNPRGHGGIVFTLDSGDTSTAARLQWTDEKGTPLAAGSVEGARAELGWRGEVPRLASCVLRTESGAELARVASDAEGHLSLCASPGVQAWLWVGLERPSTEYEEPARVLWTNRLGWRANGNRPVPPTWIRDDRWMSGRGHRLTIPITAVAEDAPPISLSLVDRETGWSLSCTLVVH